MIQKAGEDIVLTDDPGQMGAGVGPISETTKHVGNYDYVDSKC